MEPIDTQQHLRAASDAILLLVGELEQLERHKRGVSPADPRFDELARAVRESADTLAQLTLEQEAWGEQALATDAPVAPISKSTAIEPLSSLLAKWRAVERQLEQAPPGTTEAAELLDEFQRIRDAYMQAFKSRQATEEL
jgi:erythromycin esterase-like protein